MMQYIQLFNDEEKYTEKNTNIETFEKLQNIFLVEQIKKISNNSSQFVENFIENCNELTFENKSDLIEKISCIAKMDKVTPDEIAALVNIVKKLSTIISPLQFNKLLSEHQSESMQDFIIYMQIFYLDNKIKEKIKIAS